jgi:hypothetical protein
MLVLVLVVMAALLLAGASGAVVLAARYRCGRRLEQEIHTLGTAEPVASRPDPVMTSRRTAARAA